VGGRVLVEGVVTAEAEIFFAHLDQSRSRQLFGDRNFVFTGEMRYLLERLTKHAPAAEQGAPKEDAAGESSAVRPSS
jgi:hypothetical protein